MLGTSNVGAIKVSEIMLSSIGLTVSGRRGRSKKRIPTETSVLGISHRLLRLGDRQIDRQTGRQTRTEADRETEKQTGTGTMTETELETVTVTETKTEMGTETNTRD